MSQPNVNITELGGALGALPSGVKIHAVVGVSSLGAVDTPATYAKVSDLVTARGQGPLVEAAAYYINRFRRPVLIVGTGSTTAGASGAVTTVATGTSVITADDATLEPRDMYEVYFLVVTGGTIGVTGITYRWSLDGGRTMSALTALGTANTLTIPDSGVVIDFAAGTLVAGDYATFRTSAPQYNATELGTALDALGASSVAWREVHVTGALDATLFDTVDTKIAGLASGGKYRSWIGGVRVPSIAESEATYLASVSAAFAAKSTVIGTLCAGACWLTSGVSSRKYLAPVSHYVAAREASVDDEVNTADVTLGTATGVSIRDTNGNPLHHDESANPGLDDARFTVFRTHEGHAGVYINRSRIFSAEGSDFRLTPHRRVMDLGKEALRAFFVRRLNKPVLVDATTGFILEGEALEIEAGARAAMRAVLRAKPKASAVGFALSRTDNLLSTSTLTGVAAIIPLAYPETINLEVGFSNPALQVQAV